MTFQDAMAQTFSFRSLAAARSFVANGIRGLCIVLGDNGMYWVSTRRAVGWLVANGYTYAV